MPISLGCLPSFSRDVFHLSLVRVSGGVCGVCPVRGCRDQHDLPGGQQLAGDSRRDEGRLPTRGALRRAALQPVLPLQRLQAA